MRQATGCSVGIKKTNQTNTKKASQIKTGDRIAIKRMKGGKETGIRILHIGIVKGVVLDIDKIICTVDWVATDINRNIEQSRGCFASIHGPFVNDAWVQEVFCI